MGFMDALFGGSKTVDLTTPEIRGYAQQLGSFQPYRTGLGKAGRVAKNYLQAIQEGRMTDLPSVQLAMGQGAENWKELQRNLQMNTAMMPGEQQGLTAGLLSKGMLQNQDQTGMASLQGAASDIQNFSQIFNLAKANKDQTNVAADRNQISALGGAADILQRGRQRVQTKGILGGIADLASMFSPVSAGLKMLGGARGGGGGFSGDPSICWVAGELYGEGSMEQSLIRAYLLTNPATWAKAFVALYRMAGEKWAQLIQTHPSLRALTLNLFNHFLKRATN